MSPKDKKIAVFPGTFDPITNGHVDVIRRGAAIFDELVVAVGQNPEKASLMSAAARGETLGQVVGDTPNVRVASFDGLTVDFVRRIGSGIILRGIRNAGDLQFELQVALTNRVVAGVETVFIMTNVEHAFTSSSLIKQIARMGGDVSAMVPPQVLPHIRSRVGSPLADSALHEKD